MINDKVLYLMLVLLVLLLGISIGVFIRVYTADSEPIRLKRKINIEVIKEAKKREMSREEVVNDILQENYKHINSIEK